MQDTIHMLIIFNPAAGERRRRGLDVALDVLRALGLQHAVIETRYAGHAAVIAEAAMRKGAGIIVAAGGDGTIAEVASAIVGSAATLGILPLGTANVLACEVDIPRDPRGAAQVVARQHTRLVHPGLARYADGSQRLFVQMLGAGFDASIVAHLDLGLKRLFGRGAYVWQTLRELPRYEFPPISVMLDGVAETAASVIVTKGHYYGGRFVLAPGARPVEAGFHVALLQRRGPLTAMLAGAALPLGLLPRLPGLTLRRASRIELRGEGVPVQADGDPAASLPLTIEDAPTPLRLLMP